MKVPPGEGRPNHARSCLYCGQKFKPWDKTGYSARGTQLAHLDPDGHFHNMGCATRYAVIQADRIMRGQLRESKQ